MNIIGYKEMEFMMNVSPLLRDLYLGNDPDEFSIGYVINGHMEAGWKAFQQDPVGITSNVSHFWHSAHYEITTPGHSMLVGKPKPFDGIFSSADCIFAFIGNNGIRYAVASIMREDVRKHELADWVEDILPNAGFTIIQSDCHREGSGDNPFDFYYGMGGSGVGKRQDKGCGRHLSEATGRSFLEIDTTHDHFYHTDTFVAFLPLGHSVIYKAAMSEDDYEIHRCFYPDDKRYELSEDDALKLGANLQHFRSFDEKNNAVTYNLLIPEDCSEPFKRQLLEWGYANKEVDISGIRLAGGSSHCCFQLVVDLRRFPEKPLPDSFIELLHEKPHLKSKFWPSAYHAQQIKTYFTQKTGPLQNIAGFGM